MRKDGYTVGEQFMPPPVEGGIREDEDDLSYARYLSVGGIINEDDYNDALERARKIGKSAGQSMGEKQATHILSFSGLDPENQKCGVDSRVLYAVLRGDMKSKAEAPYHHSDMDDQVLLREVLLMLEDKDSARCVEQAHPNIFR